MELTVKDFYTEDGLIKAVKPVFTKRKGQQNLSKLILDAILNGEHVMAEGPTGFGKSISLLVAAVLAVKEGKRVVISTATNTLLDQYINEELPLIERAVQNHFRFEYAPAKGRHNYICRQKLSYDVASSNKLEEWARKQIVQQHTGEMESCAFTSKMAWRTIGADDDCERRKCIYYGKGSAGPTDCFVYEAQRRVLEANIVVTNHHLLALDIQYGVGGILGAYDAVLIDEAHELAEIAQDVWGTEFSPRTITSNLAKIKRRLKKVSLDHLMPDYEMDRWGDLEKQIFSHFDPQQPAQALKAYPKETIESLKPLCKKVMKDFKRVYKSIKDLNTDPVVEGCCETLRTLFDDFGRIFGETLEPDHKNNWLSFVEPRYHEVLKVKYCVLLSKPIEVGPLLRKCLWESIPSVTAISATMQVAESFKYMKMELGAPNDIQEFIGKSPFDFSKVQGYFPKHIPEQQDKYYLDYLASEITDIIKYTGGGALVLFTNISSMDFVYKRVKQNLMLHNPPIQCYMQGEESKTSLISKFKQEVDSCLFGTKSFFTGVDIPGDALRLLILTKMPFDPPTEPLFAARCKRIENKGKNAFSSYALPKMLTHFRQGFGRLIRTETDTGLVVVLDSRAFKSNYAGMIMRSLPPIQILEKIPANK